VLSLAPGVPLGAPASVLHLRPASSVATALASSLSSSSVPAHLLPAPLGLHTPPPAGVVTAPPECRISYLNVEGLLSKAEAIRKWMLRTHVPVLFLCESFADHTLFNVCSGLLHPLKLIILAEGVTPHVQSPHSLRKGLAVIYNSTLASVSPLPSNLPRGSPNAPNIAWAEVSFISCSKRPYLPIRACVVYSPPASSAIGATEQKELLSDLAASVDRHMLSNIRLVVGGDMNARLGMNGDDVVNLRGRRLLASNQALTCANNFFDMKHRVTPSLPTWSRPRSAWYPPRWIMSSSQRLSSARALQSSAHL
jgi:hypothetical protein